MSIIDIAIEAAARLSLTRGRDNKWLGHRPACGYAKPALEVAVEQDRIAASCCACGDVAGIAAVMGVPGDLVITPTRKPSKVARADNSWRNANPPVVIDQSRVGAFSPIVTPVTVTTVTVWSRWSQSHGRTFSPQ